MKQEKRTELSRKRILQSAFAEFGSTGYDGSSLNTICSKNNISKGLIYHNFSGKDELYLACVAQCISDVTEFLKQQDIQDDPEKYMQLRFEYFLKNTQHARIFFEAMLQPPKGLKTQIQKLRMEFDAFNREIYRNVLSKVTLREGVCETDAINYFEIMQEMFNGYFSSLSYTGKDFQLLVQDHEEWLAKILDFILYGIVERGINK